MFVVTDSANHIVCKSRSVNDLLRKLAVTYPSVSLIETSANVPVPQGLKLTYVS